MDETHRKAVTMIRPGPLDEREQAIIKHSQMSPWTAEIWANLAAAATARGFYVGPWDTPDLLVRALEHAAQK